MEIEGDFSVQNGVFSKNFFLVLLSLFVVDPFTINLFLSFQCFDIAVFHGILSSNPWKIGKSGKEFFSLIYKLFTIIMFIDRNERMERRFHFLRYSKKILLFFY